MKDAHEKVVIGIDVSKDTLALAHIRAGSGEILCQHTQPNTPAGHEAVIAAAAAYREAHLVMEATGNYHLRFSEALAQAGLHQSIVNPLQIKRFSQMKLARIKTDKSDAVLIAHYAKEQIPAAHSAPNLAQQHLKEISTLIEQLIKQRTALKNMAHASSLLPHGASLCEQVLREQIASINKQLQRLEQQQEQLTNQAFAKTRLLAESVKGIGRKTAIVLVAYLGDLSGFETYKQVSAYMGLNPVPKQSGDYDGPRHISKQGNARLRTLFYMCAHSASRYNSTCKALYDRLLAAGKQKKVALIAVANKLVKQVFAVIKSERLFDNNYQQQNAPTA